MVDRSCVRLIDKELTELFPDNEAVNAALRTIAEATSRTAAEGQASLRKGLTNHELTNLLEPQSA